MNLISRLTIFGVLIGAVCCPSALGEDKVYFGLLHAHTFFSDGSGTPLEAFEMAKAEGLDFFAVTPHNHILAENLAKDRKDGVLIAKNHDLYNGDSPISVFRRWKKAGTIHEETVTVISVMEAAKTVSDNNFIAIVGQEFSTISSGNHVNVFEIDEVLMVDDGDFDSFYEVLESTQEDLPYVVQLNHPNVYKDFFYGGKKSKKLNQKYNDYGIDKGDIGPDFRELIARTDKFVNLIELLTGPALTYEVFDNYHYSGDRLKHDEYYLYLGQGYHVSPSVGQDNHYKTWGKTTDARMGVYCSTLSKPALLEAFRSHKTFATEDSDLEIGLWVGGSFMGSNITTDEEAELSIEISVVDNDEPNADYTINVYHGFVTPEQAKDVSNLKPESGLIGEYTAAGDGSYEVDGLSVSTEPQFIYVQVIQNDGDRAWSAPVWLNYAKDLSGNSAFVWTANKSKYYHYADCSSVKRINTENKRSGTPPADRELHKCNRASSGDGH